MESVCSTERRVVAVKFEGLSFFLCLEVALGTSGPDPVPSLPRLKAVSGLCLEVSLGTCHLRPSDLAVRTLRSVKHRPSKFGCDPCAVRRGLVAAVLRVLCASSTCFSLSRQPLEQNKRSQSHVWVSTPQQRKPVLFSVFRPHNCRSN